MTSNAAKIRTGSIWIAGSRAITNALGILSTLVMARLLLPADFGVVAIGLTVLAITTAVTDMALTQALIHHEDPDDGHLCSAWTLNVLRGLIVGGLVAISGPMIADLYGDERLRLVMAVIGGSIFIAGFANPKLALFKRALIFRQEFVVQTVSKLTLVVVSVGVAWLTHSYLALLAGTVASQVAQVAVSYAYAPFLPRPRLTEAMSLLSFSWWLTMTQIVRTINFRFEPLLIGKFVDIHTLGLFTVANNLSMLPTRETTQPLVSTLFPAFARLRDQPQRQRQAYTRAQTLISAVALPCGILMAVLARPLVLLALGEKWVEAVFLVQVLAIVIATQTLGTALEPMAMANGRNDLLFRRSLQGLVSRVPLMVAGLYLAGMTGFLIARAIICVVMVLFNKFIIKELIGLSVREQLIDNWRTIVAATGMAAAGFAAMPYLDFGDHLLGLIAQIAAGGSIAATVYLTLLFGLWALTGKPNGPEREILEILGLITRQIQIRLFGANSREA